MDRNVLEERINQFLSHYAEERATGRQAEQLRQEFVRDFPINQINQLTLDEYTIGHGSHDSFCYRIERELEVLGMIRGPGASKQYGVYYEKSTNSYQPTTTRFGHDIPEAFIKVKRTITSLLEAGADEDYIAIDNSNLPDLFRGKLLSVYYPKKYLHVFSKAHVDHFNGLFGTDRKGYAQLTLAQRKQRLVNFKNQHPVMRRWTLWEYMRFLYTSIGRPGDRNTPGSLTDEVGATLPAIEDVIISTFEAEMGPIPPNGTPIAKKRKKKKGKKKPNYEKQERENRVLGARGETIVMKFEEQRLRREGKKELISKLDQVSLKDDTLGYDILSWDKPTKERHIEVKATKSKPGIANFIITSNELEQSSLLPNYYIYVVFKAHTKNPVVWILANPFKKQGAVKLTPIKYQVEIYSHET